MKKSRELPAPEDEAFDCLEFKRRVQAEVYEEIKDMTWEERIAYLHRSVAAGPFAKWWRTVQKEPPVIRGRRGPSDR